MMDPLKLGSMASNNLQTTAQQVGRNLRSVVTALLLTGWTAGWGMVALVGWAASSAGIMYAGLTMIGAGLVGFFGGRTIARRRLQARAQASLIARAELHRLALNDSMAARLHLFDDAWIQLQASLDDPSLPHADRSAEVAAELAGAQDELFQLVTRYVATQNEIQALRRYSPSELIAQSRQEKQDELTRIEDAADALVKETKTLASTAAQVRALASGRTGETAERLKEAVNQFNLTLSAYREVEGELAAGPRRAALPQPKAQGQQV